MAIGDRTPVEPTSGVSATMARNLLFSEAHNHADRSSGDAGHADGGASLPFPTLLGMNLGTEQMAVESDAEAGFAAGEERFFKKPHQNSISRANRRTASQVLPSIRTSSRSLVEGRQDLPQIIIETNSPQALRRSSSQVMTMSSPVRRRRWGSTLYNAFTPGEPKTAPLPNENKKAVTSGPEPPQSASVTATDTRARSFLARLRSTSFSALASPFSRIGGSRDDARSLAGTSTRGEDERWSSDSSSEEDEFLWNDSRQLAPDALNFVMGEDGDHSSWGPGSRIGGGRSREEEDADLSIDIVESP
jgi:hypothetical protein